MAGGAFAGNFSGTFVRTLVIKTITHMDTCRLEGSKEKSKLVSKGRLALTAVTIWRSSKVPHNVEKNIKRSENNVQK